MAVNHKVEGSTPSSSALFHFFPLVMLILNRVLALITITIIIIIFCNQIHFKANEAFPVEFFTYVLNTTTNYTIHSTKMGEGAMFG